MTGFYTDLRKMLIIITSDGKFTFHLKSRVIMNREKPKCQEDLGD